MKLFGVLLLLASIGLFFYAVSSWQVWLMGFALVMIVTTSLIAVSIDALSSEKRSLIEFKN